MPLGGGTAKLLGEERTEPNLRSSEPKRGFLTCFRKGERNPKELALQMQSSMYTKDKISR